MDPRSPGDRRARPRCLALRREFDSDRLAYNLDEYDGRWIEHFASSRLASQRTFLAVRVALLVVALALLGWSVAFDAAGGRIACWLFFFTHWGLLLVAAYFVCAVLVTAAGAKPSPPHAAPRSCKALWLLQSVTLPATFLVTVLYWSLVYDGDMKPITPFSHGLNFALVFVDSVLANAPIYLAHGVFFVGYLVLFLFWSLVHYYAGLTDCYGERRLYSVLDWSKPDKALEYAIVIPLLVGPLTVLLFWALLRHRSRGLPSSPRADPKEVSPLTPSRNGDIELVEGV
mmetsp:Transcript_10900/g.32530  ORF Transcript_10900/g.32530 Transcript_10900/m.32530 type:complete len:286 (-) Transcript_10900:24-881(-)